MEDGKGKSKHKGKDTGQSKGQHVDESGSEHETVTHALPGIPLETQLQGRMGILDTDMEIQLLGRMGRTFDGITMYPDRQSEGIRRRIGAGAISTGEPRSRAHADG